MKYDIFLSYRREGGYETAKHLYDLLSRDGYSVSFDIDTLKKGDFDKQLLTRIDECKDFILVVDKNAFKRTLDYSCPPEQDWLRCELSYALKKKKNIVPIFLAGIDAFPAGLPIDIADVSVKNGPQYNRTYFDAFYERLKSDFLESRPMITRQLSLGRRNFIMIAIVSLLIIGGVAWKSIAESRENIIEARDNIAKADQIIDEIKMVIDTSTMAYGVSRNAMNEAVKYYNSAMPYLSRKDSVLYNHASLRCSILSELLDSLKSFDSYTQTITYYIANERFATADRYRDLQSELARKINGKYKIICVQN